LAQPQDHLALRRALLTMFFRTRQRQPSDHVADCGANYGLIPLPRERARARTSDARPRGASA